ncbi:MAG: hypothetical protein E7425_12625 [Ruminococcaceae bacterium]|nr:hypothetical protein [Oscillospiraceae bacterium]
MFFEQDRAAAFELVDGIILLPGTAEGAEGHFALDTGATRTVLNRTYCALPGENVQNAVTFSGSEQSSAVTKLEDARVRFADTDLWLVSVPVLDMSYVECPLRDAGAFGVRFLGSIGANLLSTGRLVIDYHACRVVFNASSVPPHTREAPLFNETVPVIELDLGEGAQRFALDTGANHFIIDRACAPRALLGSVPDGMPCTLPPFRFAGREYVGVEGLVTDLGGMREALHVDGIFGYQLLRESVCCFDFAAGFLYLS